MRKMMVLAAMLAMMMVATSPAMADEWIEVDRNDGGLFTSEVSGDFFDALEDGGTFLLSEGDFDADDVVDDVFDGFGSFVVVSDFDDGDLDDDGDLENVLFV